VIFRPDWPSSGVEAVMVKDSTAHNENHIKIVATERGGKKPHYNE
jgi:hypothetical protein